MTEIRMVTDKELLKTAFSWSDLAPRWFVESQEKESLQDFLESANQKLFYGIFSPDFTALIRLNPFNQKVFEIDLFAKRDTDLSMLTQAGLSIRDYLYDKGVASGFFGWILKQNRGIRKLYSNLGFSAPGVICYRGKFGNHPGQWILMKHERG